MERMYKIDGPYDEACPACVQVQATGEEAGEINEGEFRSCRRHANAPILTPRGSVLASPQTISDINLFLGMLKARHQVKGNKQLLPRWIKRMRKLLLSTNKLSDLQTYVMILLGIKLFLRADELLSLKVESFDYESFKMDAAHIHTLAVWIKGKCDDVPVLLKIRRDDKCPHFCVMRHLFVYMKLLKIKGGLLFPKAEELRRAQANTHGTYVFKKPIPYASWRKRLKSVLLTAVPELVGDDDLQIGTHTLRKTAYLMAVWGTLCMFETYDKKKPLQDIRMGNICQSARHAAVNSIQRYVMDACGNFEDRTSDDDVGTWEMIRVVQVSSRKDMLRTEGNYRRYQKPLVDCVPVWYSQEIPGWDENPALSVVIDSTFKSKVTNPKESVMKWLYEKHGQEDFRVIRGLIEVWETAERLSGLTMGTPPAPAVAVPVPVAPAAPTAQRRSRAAADDEAPGSGAAAANDDDSLEEAPPPAKKRNWTYGTDDSLEPLCLQVKTKAAHRKSDKGPVLDLMERVKTLYHDKERGSTHAHINSVRGRANRYIKVLAAAKVCMANHKEAFDSKWLVPDAKSFPIGKYKCVCNVDVD